MVGFHDVAGMGDDDGDDEGTGTATTATAATATRFGTHDDVDFCKVINFR
jgi:hypothetical protein